MKRAKTPLKKESPEFYKWFRGHVERNKKSISELLVELKPYVEIYEAGARDVPFLNKLAEVCCKLYRLEKRIADPEGILKERDRPKTYNVKGSNLKAEVQKLFREKRAKKPNRTSFDIQKEILCRIG